MKQRSSTTISVVLADDHPVVLHGIADILHSTGDIRVAALCDNGGDAIEAVRKFNPHVAVLDIGMPDKTGLDILSRIVAAHPSTAVVFLTATASETQISEVVTGGAKGVFLKQHAPHKLIECVRTVAAGHDWFPPEVSNAVSRTQTARGSTKSAHFQSLTLREREVMSMVAQGSSNKEVARRLGVSEATVKIHLHNVYKKTGIANRTALATFRAHRDKLVDKRGRRK